MSVEKIPNMAAHGANNIKNGVSKAARVADGASAVSAAGDSKGGFGAILSGLGAEDAVTNNEAPAPPEDQSVSDLSAIPLASPSQGAAKSVYEVATGDSETILLQVGSAPVVVDGLLVATDEMSSAVLPRSKQGFRAPVQTDLSQSPNSAGFDNAVTQAVRSPKERGRIEISTVAAATPAQAGLAVDAGKQDRRGVSEKVEILARTFAPAAVNALVLEGGLQIEVQRDKAIFKVNSATAGADISLSNAMEAKPKGLNLEGMAPDVGARMSQGDQNPGTYWMSSDMKNAELKLDGLGESPVEVSISVHGNQTHVAFRTDEMLTRLALEDAGDTLRELLSQEGLDLAGVSIGASGAGSDKDHKHRPRHDGRPMPLNNLASKFPAGTSGQVVTGRVGHLDVFV